MKKIIILVLLLVFATASPAFAHGLRSTPDGPDKGRSIQYTVPSALMARDGFRAGIRSWNAVPGPRLDRVASVAKRRAEVTIIYRDYCYFEGSAYGGWAQRYYPGGPTICVSRYSPYGVWWPAKYIKRITLHEWGHFYGLAHHSTFYPLSIMEVVEGKSVFHLTKHDRRWKRNL